MSLLTTYDEGLAIDLSADLFRLNSEVSEHLAVNIETGR